MKTEWKNLLSDKRWGSRAGTLPGHRAGDDSRSPFERDYGRVLYSSAFRRLQDKTQVFPLGRNDYVRTRLTHSLEVAHVGTSLGRIVGSTLIARHADELRGVRPSHFGSIVGTACLAHDIGNPPFGHLGESAIEAALKKFGFPRKFEGNAQGFRLLTRVGDPMAGKGLKLTAAVLATFMKYPCSESFSREVACGNASCGIESKKFGFISDDADAARFVAEATGMLPLCDDGENVAWKRHPLAFLVEAADDLSYLVADIEDALVSKIIPFSAVRDYLYPFVPAEERSRADEIARDEGDESAVHFVRAVAIGAGIRVAAEVFLANEEKLLAGTQQCSLFEDSEFAAAMKNLREYSAENVYNAASVFSVELTGFRIIEALFEFLLEWVRDPKSAKGKKIARMLGGEKWTAFAEKSENDRLLHLLDYVSGMTDSFALATYQKLYGI